MVENVKLLFLNLIIFIVLLQLKRYKTYTYILRSHLSQYPDMDVSLAENSIGELDEASGIAILESSSTGVVPPPIPDRRSSPVTNRYSYRQAIYNRAMLNGGADVG